MFAKLCAARNKKGFTLAELLIVVAIIGVLVAVAIPVFSSSLEKAREATDAANIRAAYAEVIAAGMSGSTTTSELKKVVNLKQTTDGWTTGAVPDFPANLDGAKTGTPKKTGTATIEYDGTNNKATCTFSS